MDDDQARHMARAIRAAGGSQTKLAKAAGLSQQQISRLLRGDQKISAETAVRLEKASNGAVPRWETRPDLWAPVGATA